MAAVAESLLVAVEHHRAGRFAAAEGIYRQILAVDPRHVDALHLLGGIAYEAGNFPAAVELIERAIQLNPADPMMRVNLGKAFARQKNYDRAIAAYQQAIHLAPERFEPYFHLGNSWRCLHRLEEAFAAYSTAMRLNPNYAEAYNGIGLVLFSQDKRPAALEQFQQALKHNPTFYEAASNVGLVLRRMENTDGAVAAFRSALAINPNYVDAYVGLCKTYCDKGDFAAAETAIQQAIAVNPRSAEAFNQRGIILTDQGRHDEALSAYRQALELEPENSAVLNNLGNSLRQRGELDDAISCLRRAIQIKPDSVEGNVNLAAALLELGEVNEAVAAYRQALQLNPQSLEAHSSLLMAIQYRTGVTLAELADAHAEYNCRHARQWTNQAAQKPRDPARRGKLRLGFVSRDLGRHPVGYFMSQVLRYLREASGTTICYSDRIVKDDLTQRLQASSHVWRDTHAWSDETLAATIRSDDVDVLFDLGGHSANNRLQVFARRPAPMQITWMGYMCTTGLTAMDYLLADHYEVPPTAERFFSERILRMPHGHVCYEPPEYAPPVSRLPAAERGYVTFGCFNNSAKITPQALGVWAQILHRCPRAKLVLKNKGLGDPPVQRRFFQAFARYGIDAQRIEMLNGSPHLELLQTYQNVDLALDPFPYTGCLTTCEALWMGVPVINFPGETLTSRQSYSCIMNSSLTGTVGETLEEYVDRAVEWASDLPRLAEVRANLRPQMANSPLCDGRRFVSEFTALLDAAWEDGNENGQRS